MPQITQEPSLLDRVRALRVVPVEGHGLFYGLPTALRDELVATLERMDDDGR